MGVAGLLCLDQAGVSLYEDVFASAAAARADGSIVIGGYTSGDWDGEMIGYFDFVAVALDEYGTELWRWQVCEQPDPSICLCFRFRSMVMAWKSCR